MAVVIVHFRTPDELQRLVAALATQMRRPDEVVIVDNSAALDGRPEPSWVAGGALWHAPGTNIGYGAACNVGAQLSTAEHLLFLNADLTPEPGACEALLRATTLIGRVAVAGPQILGRDGKMQVSARRFPTRRTALVGRSSRLTALLRRFGRLPRELTPSRGEGGPVDWVSGACMLVRRSAFQEVGGFDEGYWMYWEDADLCRRLAKRGWRTVFVPGAVVRHDVGASGRNAHTTKAFHRSAARYWGRHVTRSTLERRLGEFLLTARCRASLWRGRWRRMRSSDPVP